MNKNFFVSTNHQEVLSFWPIFGVPSFFPAKTGKYVLRPQFLQYLLFKVMAITHITTGLAMV